MKGRKVWVEVSRSALENNIKQLRARLAEGTKFMAVVKSNAYGHGLVEVADVAVSAGADWLGVDSIDEALRLRAAGLTVPVLVLGYTLNDRLEDAIKHDIHLIAYNAETIEALEVAGERLKKKAKVHMKIETGTSRQGLHEDDAITFAQFVRSQNWVVLDGASTHFANIEDTTDHSYAEEQLHKFTRIAEKIVTDSGKLEVVHSACSAALILFPETHFDMVRAGISMYGHWSSPQTLASAKEKLLNVNLTPALTWKTRVAQVKLLEKGTCVSYGLTEKVSRDSRVAVLPVGYWDGVDRKLSSMGEVLIRGHRAKILGRVCMNMTVVDVTDIPEVEPEDEVVLIGTQGEETITAEDVAAKVGTIQYEVMTRINPVIPRVLVN